jgi:hypothetical protein
MKLNFANTSNSIFVFVRLVVASNVFGLEMPSYFSFALGEYSAPWLYKRDSL